VILSAVYLFVFLCFLSVLCVYVVSFLSNFFPFLCLTLDGLFSFEILQSWVRLSQNTLCALFHNADSMCYSSKTTRLLKEPCAAASSPFTRKRTRFRFVQFFPRIFELHFEYLIRYQEQHFALELVSNFCKSSFDLCDDLLRIAGRLCPFCSTCGFLLLVRIKLKYISC